MNHPNDDVLAGGAAQDIRDVAQSVSRHYAEDDLSCKAKATITAQFARRGYSLSELSDGSFLVHRWNLARSLVDLRAASCFLRQIGGAQ